MRLWTIAALALTYALFGVLMNSVGVVILQSIQQLGATKPLAATLEACKDLSVVAASFLFATRIAAFGYRRALIGVLLAIAVAAIAASSLATFPAMQLLFVATGLSFGVAKVATYSTIGLLADNPAEHASLTSIVEGVFMIGVLAGTWLFSAFVADGAGGQWLRIYWLLAGLSVVLATMWLTIRLDERAALGRDGDAPAGLRAMTTLAVLPATLAVLAALFLYVLIEQGVGTWLPTFNAEVLRLPASVSVQMSSIYVAALAAGRLASGIVLRRVDWLPVLLICLGGAASLVVVTLPLASGLPANGSTGWRDAPAAAWLFPLIGFFLAPIYPTICSVALSALPRTQHPGLIGLIVIFSALGGTIGSMITGLLFASFSGAVAFYFVLLPAGMLAAALLLIRRPQRIRVAA